MNKRKDIERQMYKNYDRRIFFENVIDRAENKNCLDGIFSAIKHNYNLPLKERRKYLAIIEIKKRKDGK